MNDKEQAIAIDIEMQAQMINGHWDKLKEVNKWKFRNKESEDACKTLFIAGYQCAWQDACEISKRACELDDILGRQV